MTHLEQLIFEWLDFRGYIVRHNVRVGMLGDGGYSGEIDIAAYHPTTRHCLHIECQIDAGSWEHRKEVLQRKFDIGKKFIFKEVFPWLGTGGDTQLDQWAIVWAKRKNRDVICGRKVISVKQLYCGIAHDILMSIGKHNRIVSEKYPLLRTIQQTIDHVASRQEIAAKISGAGLLPNKPPDTGLSA